MCLPGAASAQWVTSGTNINNTNTGNVGVGTSAPNGKLHIADSLAGFDPILKLEDKIDPGNGATRLTLTNPRSTLLIEAFGSSSYGILSNAAGVTALPPASALFIGSGSKMPLYMFANDSYMKPQVTLSPAGNLGINTTAPLARLHVEGSSTYNTNGVFSAIYAKGTADYPMALMLDGTGTSDSIARLRALNNGQTKWQLNFGDDLFFYNWTDTFNVRMALKVNGDVGIGTTAPAAKLHVAGDIKVDGNINAKYQDVAEWVPSTQKLKAGTVVVLDPERPNHVLASNAAYDTAVAGVVSEKPGLALGDAGDGKALVATTGRVKVRVDATRAAIRIGDLLVTSEVEGVAMKSEPVAVGGRRIHAPGTIIGKALEPLAGGKGEILVLLSLQ
jgi:hypothetical protein